MNLKRHYRVHNFDEYNTLFNELVEKTKNTIVTFFCGSLNEEGKSWCSDCNLALPIVNTVINEPKRQDNIISPGHFIFVNIDRDQWKNEACEFRTRADLQLTKIPTLMRWENGSEKYRLIENECCNVDAVSSLFALTL